MRLIDADALLENFHKKRNPQEGADSTNQRHRYMQFLEDCEAIRNAPTIDAVPVRHGRWTADEAMYTYGEAQCSVCKTTFYADDLYMVGEKAQSEMPYYCPHCGAKMDGERKEE